jgi:tetratricopeptide (TPR) repeat protein
VEQYRNNSKPTPVVAEEMNVSYVLEGSGQKLGNRLILTVTLIVGKDDRQLWSQPYDRVIEEVEDMIDIQKEIAQMVAKEIEAVITPEEERLMETIPTTNLTAFDFYTQGREKMFEYWSARDHSDLERAENLFHVALEQDPTFAEVYIGLAWVYWYKNYYRDYLAEEFLDSVPIFVDKALQFNGELSEAYVIRGNYFNEMGESQKADEAFNQAIRLNPNDWMAYGLKALLYSNIDLVEYIKNTLKSIQYERGSAFTRLLRTVGGAFASAGYFDKGMEYLNRALEFDGDSVSFFMTLGNFEAIRGNYDRAIQAQLRVLELDPDLVDVLSDLGYSYSFIGQLDESVAYYERWLNRKSDLDNPQYTNLHRLGYAYYKAGREEEAEEFFTARFDICQLLIKLNRNAAKTLFPYYDIAAISAFRGEIDSAYANLRIFNKREMMPLWMVNLINDDPLFDNIRDEPEFHQILRDVEAKYQAEHEQVRLWLEENDML